MSSHVGEPGPRRLDASGGRVGLCLALSLGLWGNAACRASSVASVSQSPAATGAHVAAGPCTRTEWDGESDAPARQVRYRYDRDGRLRTEDEDFEELCFVEGGYENEGCMDVEREADGTFDRRTEYTYDRHGRLAHIREHDHPRGGYVVSTTFRYDEAGRVVTKIRQGTTTRYTYEGDRLVREEVTSKGDKRPHAVVEHGYDAAGRRVRSAERWPGSDKANVTVFAYDGRGRLAEQTTRDSFDHGETPEVVTYTYDDHDREVSRTHRHGERIDETVRTDYDANGNPRTQRTLLGSDVVTRVEWRYDCR